MPTEMQRINDKWIKEVEQTVANANRIDEINMYLLTIGGISKSRGWYQD
jgi:hypothetical protein